MYIFAHPCVKEDNYHGNSMSRGVIITSRLTQMPVGTPAEISRDHSSRILRI